MLGFGTVESAAATGADVQPLAFSNRQVARLAWCEDQLRPQGFAGFIQQRRQHVDAVFLLRRWHLLLGHRRERGKKVDLADQLIGLSSRFDFARPFRDQGHAVSAFPDAELEPEQLAIGLMPGFDRIASCSVEHGTVVAGEENECVFS